MIDGPTGWEGPLVLTPATASPEQVTTKEAPMGHDETPQPLDHQSVAEQMDAAILAVRKTHGGTHSREVVMDALHRELEQRGRWPQPQPWLDAVASELEAGGVYTMGTGAGGGETHETPSDPAGSIPR